MDAERIKEIKQAGEAFATSMINRGGVIDLAINIENTLTDIIAWCFCPTDNKWDVDIYNQLDEDGINLKALLLRRIDFNEKIKILKDVILTKSLLPWESNKTLIGNITKELNHVRDFRNLLVHSPLDTSKETLDSLTYRAGTGTEDFQVLEYKNGRVIKHRIDSARIKSETAIMMRVWYRLIQLFALLKGDAEDARVSEILSNLSEEDTDIILRKLGLKKNEEDSK